MKEIFINIFMKKVVQPVFILMIFLIGIGCSSPNDSSKGPHRIISELNIGETKDIKLKNNDIVELSLLGITEIRDSVRNAIRDAYVKISVDGEEKTIHCGNYHLPVVVGKIQIDCPAIKGYYSNASNDLWKLSKDARFRIWEKGSDYAEPATFFYPVKQKWFATMTASGNEPAYTDWGEGARRKTIYYHAPFDFGGAEGMDEIVSATDGLVISAHGEILPEYRGEKLRALGWKDAVYIIDSRGWSIQYVHLDSVVPSIKSGARVKMGQRIGFMGKQSTSGGWTHLHFGMYTKDTLSNSWQLEDPYPYLWEAYVQQYKPSIIAVARPHHLTWTNEEVTLDGSKSNSFAGEITAYEWMFSDGTTAEGAVQKKVYDRPGEYSEILKVTDSKGNTDYDFAVVQVYGKDIAEHTIPTIHAAYHPTLDIKAGDPVVFLVRTFNATTGDEVWDFGDGSPRVTVHSETVDRENPVAGEYAKTTHSFSKPGHYIVSVQRTNEDGFTATARLHLEVGK